MEYMCELSESRIMSSLRVSIADTAEVTPCQFWTLQLLIKDYRRRIAMLNSPHAHSR
ncbi:Uncharacterized protein DAT39_008615 [Clarias magur]|uniref:Uncharacterized protein n=1 Tax=Clarias magur TaxID=1594786 RepID=A0A8J4TNZ2_CLAMG|nr:Uncharacterized protein DAT39_008615 [Clarias magur]